MTVLKSTSAPIIATVIAMSALASPANAAPVVENPDACKAMFPNANCLNYGPGNPGRYYGLVPPVVYNSGGPGYKLGYQGAPYAYYPAYRTGFAPLDFADTVAGTAIGAAGTIALAPFNSRSWEGGYYDRY